MRFKVYLSDMLIPYKLYSIEMVWWFMLVYVVCYLLYRKQFINGAAKTNNVLFFPLPFLSVVAAIVTADGGGVVSDDDHLFI